MPVSVNFIPVASWVAVSHFLVFYRVGDFGEEGSSYTGSVTGSSSSSVSTSSSRSVSAKMVYLGSDGRYSISCELRSLD